MRDDIPTATHTETMTIAGKTLKVHVLDNGQRVIDAEDAARFLTEYLGVDLAPPQAFEDPPF